MWMPRTEDGIDDRVDFAARGYHHGFACQRDGWKCHYKHFVQHKITITNPVIQMPAEWNNGQRADELDLDGGNIYIGIRMDDRSADYPGGLARDDTNAVNHTSQFDLDCLVYDVPGCDEDAVADMES